MKKTRKLFLFALAVTLFAVVFCFSASALEETGSCGPNVTWNFESSTGILTISGNGSMNDYNTDTSPFYKNNDIKRVVIKDGVNAIGSDTFSYCESLTSVAFSDSVTSIGEGAFSFCTGLEDITVGNGVTAIEDYAFFHCLNINAVTFPDGIKSIGAYAFQYCDSLESLTVPDSVKTIGEYAFYFCSSLKNVSIGNGVTSLSDGIFGGCTKLESVSLGKGIASLYDTFCPYESIKVITFINPDCEIYDDAAVIPSTATIYGYAGSTAQTYAEKYGREFVVIEDVHVHSIVELSAVAATYTKTGLTEGKKCSECGKVTVKQKKTPKKKLKKVTVSSVKSTKKKTALVTWKKVTDASGYIVE